jgi:dipeptidyl aminopeptidase/acylaminoacyl peptidase
MLCSRRRFTALVLLSFLLVGLVQHRGFTAGGPPVASAAASAFTIEQILGVASPSELVPSPTGHAVAWVFNERGRRNVWVAEGAELRARPLTSFTEDDGQQMADLSWTPDGRAVLFTRGDADGAGGDPLNPTSDVAGVTRDIFVAPLDGSAPRMLGEGEAPDGSPTGDQVAFLRDGQAWIVPIRGTSPAQRLFRIPGQVSGLAWSPDGTALAFSVSRGAHTLIGVFHRNRRFLEYVSPGFDRDLYPRWSSDGRQIAFIRLLNVESTMRSSGRWGPIDSPWLVMTATRRGADQDFGPGQEIWRAPANPIGSFPRNLQFLDWVRGNRLVFASEHEDWAHLYLVDPAKPGSLPVLLTPGACEVGQAALSADRATIFIESNCGDLERRHLWRVTLPSGAGGAAVQPERLTTGTGVETTPVPTADGQTLVFLKGDARTPMLPHALSLATDAVTPPVAGAIPSSFPQQALVEPSVAVFKAPDGREIHAVVFEPPASAGAAPIRHPALIHVHGGPTAGQELLGWQPIFQYYASRGYVVLGLNYRGGAGYGRSFREFADQGAAGAGEYQDVLAAVTYLRSRPDVDPSRLGIWGASYGGYLTQLTLARNSDLVAAGVTECGIFDLAANARPTQAASRGGDAARIARESSAVGSIDKWKSPVLVIHGDDDPGVDFNLQTVALVRALRARGVPFEQIVFPGEGHGSSVYAHAIKVHQATADFFDRMLVRRVPPTGYY